MWQFNFHCVFVNFDFFLVSFSQEARDFLKCPLSPLLTLWALAASGYVSRLECLLDPADLLLLLQKYS